MQYNIFEVRGICHPASSTGTKASFKTLGCVEKQKITQIYVEIATYEDDITTKLSMIGRSPHYRETRICSLELNRYMDIQHSTKLDNRERVCAGD
jgi:hypothetical protein